MLVAFKKHIQDNHLFAQNERILLAVSGGIDSMVMLHLFHQSGYSFGVAHCNFQLRGNDSESDNAFVKKQCEQLSVPFFSKRFDTNNYATASGLSIQMAARELRYLWFYEMLAKEDYTFLATAHHLNDAIETTLLNLTRGSGIEGLSGIPVINDRIVRPLLFSSRKEVEAYATQHGIQWREDKSNASDDYQRNFIRHQIMPKLRELNPSLEQSVQKSLMKLQGAGHMMSWGLDPWKAEHIRQHGDKIYLNKAGLLTRHAVAVLYEVIKSYGFNWDQCTEIIQCLSGQPGKRFLSSVYKLVIDRESLIIYPSDELDEEIIITEQQNPVQLGPWMMKSEIRIDLNPGKEKTIAILDYDKLQFPVRWRKWKPGDSFLPLGMQGRKKLSDFYIDIKLSQADKNTATVLESAGEIAWVVGHRIDDRFKLTPDTKRAVAFTVAPYFI